MPRSWIEAHRQTLGGHVGLRLADGAFAEMEDRGRKHGRCMAVADALDEMIERADPARGDHRNGYGIGDGAGKRDVETLPGAVAIHGGQENLAGAERDNFARVIDRIKTGRVASAMGEDFPAIAYSRSCRP